MTVHLPHFRGPQDVFHLMSVLSPIDKDLLLVYSPLIPISFRNELLDRGFQLIELPQAEFESMGGNVLTYAPRECLVLEGNPQTRMLLEEAGCKVSSYPGTEISMKAGGGPTCLTRPILRQK
jgi:N-dimethylarginine dimethylaminohydrolase